MFSRSFFVKATLIFLGLLASPRGFTGTQTEDSPPQILKEAPCAAFLTTKSVSPQGALHAIAGFKSFRDEEVWWIDSSSNSPGEVIDDHLATGYSALSKKGVTERLLVITPRKLKTTPLDRLNSITAISPEQSSELRGLDIQGRDEVSQMLDNMESSSQAISEQASRSEFTRVYPEYEKWKNLPMFAAAFGMLGLEYYLLVSQAGETDARVVKMFFDNALKAMHLADLSPMRKYLIGMMGAVIGMPAYQVGMILSFNTPPSKKFSNKAFVSWMQRARQILQNPHKGEFAYLGQDIPLVTSAIPVTCRGTPWTSEAERAEKQQECDVVDSQTVLDGLSQETLAARVGFGLRRISRPIWVKFLKLLTERAKYTTFAFDMLLQVKEDTDGKLVPELSVLIRSRK